MPEKITGDTGKGINFMDNSKYIAKLVGPTMVALLLSENKLIQPHLYDAQIPPVVYLSGALFFVAGLAIVRVHNYWARNWTVLITLTGWSAIFLGLFRMFGAGLYQQNVKNGASLLVIEIIGLAIGVFLTFKAYSKDK